MTDATTESKKVIRRTLPQPPQEIESALLSPVRSISDVSHVQCIAQVNNQLTIHEEEVTDEVPFSVKNVNRTDDEKLRLVPDSSTSGMAMSSSQGTCAVSGL
ncbi:hypothetical protein CCH79_00017626 [Gambusia affinis]|uniref:Uncharacterized protein n=1 Tax=Gambusia affinis TaxID=33528 RepID=A0A315USC3_GAMAF|nr:hypothetical protein CCH79_00017626 [Gambusia affinis]